MMHGELSDQQVKRLVALKDGEVTRVGDIMRVRRGYYRLEHLSQEGFSQTHPFPHYFRLPEPAAKAARR